MAAAQIIISAHDNLQTNGRLLSTLPKLAQIPFDAYEAANFAHKQKDGSDTNTCLYKVPTDQTFCFNLAGQLSEVKLSNSNYKTTTENCINISI